MQKNLFPLLKFALDVPGNTQPFGRGVIPDHPVLETYEGFMNGTDEGFACLRS